MDQDPPSLSPIFALLGISAAFAVLTVIMWCNHRPPDGPPGGEPNEERTSGVEVSSSRLIPPACTYGTGAGMVSGSESTCPVCLCDFKDGEQIRLLPECMHYYHTPCIDMWLRSHSSCPMCRSDATSPLRRPDSGQLPAPDFVGASGLDR